MQARKKIQSASASAEFWPIQRLVHSGPDPSILSSSGQGAGTHVPGAHTDKVGESFFPLLVAPRSVTQREFPTHQV